ncbi:MAG: hypothetical protein JXK16_03790 [Thiotrichales bacterium]|nr:hypothetical protein [Thiotrichales bacterium]
MNKLMEHINKIEQKKRRVVARSLIIVGILLAYSPYWITLIINSGSEVKVADTIVSIGWWILTPGLILYFLNIWLNYKTDLNNSNASE